LTVNAGATTNDAVLLIGTGKTTVNALGTNSVTVDSTNSTAATTINFSGSSANDVAIFTSLGQVSAAASLVGGSGTDVLKINNTSSDTTNSDVALRSVGAGWSTLTFASTGGNTIALGTNFTNAGFKTVNGLGTADSVTVTNTTLNGVTFSGGVGTGMDSLTLNNAGGSATVVNFKSVIGTTAVDALTIGTTGNANIGISLLAGSSVTDLNTNNSTMVVTGATSIVGNMGNETITLGGQGTFATTVNSGGGNDVLILQGNTSGVSVTTGGNTGVFSILGGISGTNLSSSYTIASAAAGGQYVTTNVETISFAAGSGVTADMVFNNTGSLSVAYSYTLAGNDTAAFSIGTGMVASNLGSGGYFGLTVNSGANDTILIDDSNWTGSATKSANVFINAGVANTVILGTNTTNSSLVQEVGVNLTSLGASTNTSNGFVVTNWGTGTDAIQLGGTGAFLASANQAATNSKTLLNSASLNAGNVVTNTNSFNLGTTFVTGTSTQLANLASANSSGVTTNGGQIFDVQGSIGANTNFTSQAGINTAVSFITTNIGSATGGLVANQQAVLAVHDANSNTALFLFTNGSATSGIQANELKLIGVVNNLTSTSASSFN